MMTVIKFRQRRKEKMNKLLKIAVFVLGLSLLLSACGGGGTNVNVTLTDFAYDPATITVPAGAQVTLHAKNNGAVEHEFVIMEKGYQVQTPWGDKDESHIYWELDEIQPGATKSDTFTAPSEPGEYEITCGLAGHIENGMVGKLIVK